MSTAAGLAAAISPAAFGFITDVTGSYRVPFILSIALMGVGIAVSFLMRPDRPLLREVSAPSSGFEPNLASAEL
jgi:cyanate permease